MQRRGPIGKHEARRWKEAKDIGYFPFGIFHFSFVLDW